MTPKANRFAQTGAITSRRTFLGRTALAAATVSIMPRHVLGGDGKPSANEKLEHRRHRRGRARRRRPAGDGGENIVALCDVDWKYAAHTFKAYPKAEVFKDYRVMLEKRKDIDAVMIATPDHMHAPIALAALRAGKHVYVEKPMAHSIEEARVMTRVAKETGLVTQMGNNGHAGEGLRLIREWIQGGVIGAVREIHCWSDRPGTFWKQDLDRPTETPPVPPDLDWNLWLGAAPLRPYHPVYMSTGLARLVRLRHRRPGRHGDPQHGSRLLRAGSRRPGGNRGPDQSAEEGIVSGLDDHHLRVCRQGQTARR